MEKKIKAGKHRAWPPSVGLFWNCREFHRLIIFDESWKYQVDANHHINKLFGVGYVNGGHHKDSARFGCRYAPARDKIEIFSYCYISGLRREKLLCIVRFNTPYYFKLKVIEDAYQFEVSERKDAHDIVKYWQPYRHKKKLQYPLGIYFGGEQTAPHDILTDIRKV